MGCDICIHLETKRKKDDILGWKESMMSPGGIGERCYDIFAALADVRGTVKEPLEPKGFPDDASYSVMREYYNYRPKDGDMEKQWVKNLMVSREYHEFEDRLTGEKTLCLRDPEMHSASYLSTEEYSETLRSNFKRSEIPTEYRALLKLMEAYERLGYHARIVFWFNN